MTKTDNWIEVTIDGEQVRVPIEESELSARGREWMLFSGKVLQHVENYTVGQYGDKGEDMATNMSIEACATEIKRYLYRLGRGQRGIAEARRDLLKVAHYACIIADKLEEESLAD